MILKSRTLVNVKNVVIDDDESTNDHLLWESEKYFPPYSHITLVFSKVDYFVYRELCIEYIFIILFLQYYKYFLIK